MIILTIKRTISRATLEGMAPSHDLSHVEISDINLRGINLQGGSLCKATLCNVDLSGADLSDVVGLPSSLDKERPL